MLAESCSSCKREGEGQQREREEDGRVLLDALADADLGLSLPREQRIDGGRPRPAERPDRPVKEQCRSLRRREREGTTRRKGVGRRTATHREL